LIDGDGLDAYSKSGADPRVEPLRSDDDGRFFFLMAHRVAREAEVLDPKSMKMELRKTVEYEAAEFVVNFRERLIEVLSKRNHGAAVAAFLSKLAPDEFLTESYELDIPLIIETLRDAGLIANILSLTWKVWDIKEGRIKRPTLEPADAKESEKILEDPSLAFVRCTIEMTQPSRGDVLKISSNGSFGFKSDDPDGLEEIARRVILAPMARQSEL
jgi:hypothetical protein